MAFTIWRQGVVLGTTELSMRSPGPATRVGYLDPTDDFERAWPQLGPVVEEFLAATTAMSGAVGMLPPTDPAADPAERGRQVYERLSKHPGVARVRAASEALTSLRFELRDSDGEVIPTRFLMIQHVRLPEWIPEDTIARYMEEAREEGLNLRIPAYIVVVGDVSDTPSAGLPTYQA